MTAIDYHEACCPACTALREAVQLGPVDLVWHCSEHGPFVDRVHSGTQDCPRCQWDSPLGRLVQDVLAGDGSEGYEP